jgi:uncharacterized protein
MDNDRDIYSLEIRQLIREALLAGIGGEFTDHSDFPCLLVRNFYDMFTEVDGLPLYPREIPPVFLHWAKMDESVHWNKEDFLVLDLETTGLGRGQTVAFLIGLGYFENDRYVVEQIFLPEPEAEANSFDRLIELVRQKSVLVTFNGKTFDLPILESRLLYNRVWLELREKQHIDLLHLARRLWKNKIPACALETIEFYILGYIRDKELDIEGGLIPQTYFQFLISGDTDLLSRIFIHNQFDVLHTMALLALICDHIGYPPVDGFDQRIDYHALARLYLSQGHQETARAILVDLLAEDYFSGDIACDLGLLYKKEGDPDSAESCFAMSASLEHPAGTLEYCKALEKCKKYDAALEFSLKLLHWHLSRSMIDGKKVLELEKRIRRLRKKLGE